MGQDRWREEADGKATSGLSVVANRPDGSVVFFIRMAGKPIEFEKGKAGIASRIGKKSCRKPSIR